MNGRVGPAHLARIAALDLDGAALLATAASRLSLSSRAVHRTLRVARAIADLAGHESVAVDDLEALQFRAAVAPAPP